jgi:hypothetical protein
VADDDESAPFECPDEIATAEVDQVKAKSKEKSKKDKVWPAQAVKIESVVNRAAVHKGMKSTSRPSSRPSTPTGSADSNPHALRSADRREEVVADGVADDDERAPLECPDEIATAEVDQVKAKSKEKSKKDKVWPAQAVKIESVVNRAAVHKGMESTSRPSSRPSTPTGSADSNPHALRSADRREEVVADGVAADVLLGKLKKDISFALRRGTIAQVTSALDAGQRAAEDELALNMAGWDR